MMLVRFENGKRGWVPVEHKVGDYITMALDFPEADYVSIASTIVEIL
jgi:hypothetical protein